MKDFFYVAEQIGLANPIAAGKSSLVRYFRLDGSAFTGETDSSQYGRNSQGWGGYNSSAPGLPAPGFLLDQHQPTLGACFQAGHGFSNVFTWNGKQDTGIDDFQNQSWSLVFAGLKPHDMSTARGWHGIGSGSDIGGTVVVNTDGSLTVTSAVANAVSSSAGAIVQYAPHLVVVSYDNVAQKITVYVGDWTGRWVTAINAAAGAPIATSAPFPIVGGTRGGLRADGFLDDYAVYIGHAITSSEASSLFAATGYQDATVSYTTSPGHRNGPFNRAYPSGQTLDSTSAAAVAEFASKADSTQINGAGAFNPSSSSTSQFTTSIYVVSGSFRKNSANWMKLNGPSHYGDQAQVMAFEDCPVPFSGRPSLGFAPSSGSDAHACIWCPDTDEYWDIGVMSNSGTDSAPVWNFVYGNKQTGFSTFMGAFGNGQGATATGIPNMLGVPKAADLQNAIYNGVPIPHGLAAVMYDGLATQVWPANRHDGSKASGSSVIEGQTYRLKHDAATTAAIASMPHPTGRAMAQAAQTYGIVIVDRNVFATLLQTEDFHSSTAYNGGANPYTTDPVGKPALGGLLNGQTFSVNTMQGFPWTSLELLDHTQINPGDSTQPLRSAPTGLSGQHTIGKVALTWPDDPLASYWQIYTKTPLAISLSAGLSTSGAVTSLPVAAVTQAIPGNSQITLTSGAHTQTFTTSALTTVNATTIPVISQTPNFAYPTSSTITLRQWTARTYWPSYTVWNPLSTMTLAVTAVNGGGESPLSLDFTPPLPIRSRRRPRAVMS